MNRYITPNKRVVEFGSGAGFSATYLATNDLVLTDIEIRPWIDLVADATTPPFRPESIDIIICNQVLHHIPSPARFFESAETVLRPGGFILINEPETSFLLRLVLRVMRHEGWSYDVDPFDRDELCVDGDDPWGGNAAVANLLFSNPAEFEAKFPQFSVVENALTECFIFLLSGGVSTTTLSVPLPNRARPLLKWLDRALIGALPGVFALGRRVALEKRV